jgi:PKD repeat protein
LATARSAETAPHRTISPQNPTVDAGKTVAWSATYSGFSSTPSFAWTFGGGNPSSSSSRTQTVTYSNAGSYTTRLTLTRSGTRATCSTGVTVRAADTTPPTVSLSSSTPAPFNPPASVTLTASASDNRGVTWVEFYDGTTLKGTDTSSPYSYNWSITATDAGSHTWTAKAYDAANNVGTSAALTLVVNGAGNTSNVSINSTSQSMADAGVSPGGLKPVAEAPRPKSANSLSPAAGTGNTSYQILAINDLGMHCGDRDTRVASILPPFQVLLSQVIRKGEEPSILGPTQAQVGYSAASNPSDPILSARTEPGTGYPFTGRLPGGSVFKTNFWDIAYQAYNPFYPAGILCNPDGTTPAPCFAMDPDVGLPVPNVEQLYIGPNGRVKDGDESPTAVQHAMPGVANPYIRNDAQTAEEHYGDKPFFVNFPFGYVANDVNWFEGAGVPFAAFDDAGRENPYPLVRVQAKSGNTVLATVDTVLPISGEANCQGCHAASYDGGNGAGIKSLEAAIVRTSINDPQEGAVPVDVSVEWASDLNILKLHDQKHATALVTGTTADFPRPGQKAFEPVVCQRCHYTPALDLAQVGPSTDNGRDQVKHKSMSNVMHSHHATVKDVNGKPLFQDMPAPTTDSATTGLPGNQDEREAVLEETCYQCHPGNKTKCMRGAMADGGMVCQDCHGQMAPVGDDFSRKVSPTNPGAFELAKDFYTNPATPRVPWANEPGCGSCHTGDAISSLAGSLGTLRNGFDTNGNADGTRLLRAYRSTDAKATPIVPTNKRFA